VLAGDFEVRVLKALPWLAVHYHNLGWSSWYAKPRCEMSKPARIRRHAGAAVEEKRGDLVAAGLFYQVEEILERARLVREDTLCQESLSNAKRGWLRQTRATEAREDHPHPGNLGSPYRLCPEARSRRQA